MTGEKQKVYNKPDKTSEVNGSEERTNKFGNRPKLLQRNKKKSKKIDRCRLYKR